MIIHVKKKVKFIKLNDHYNPICIKVDGKSIASCQKIERKWLGKNLINK